MLSVVRDDRGRPLPGVRSIEAIFHNFRLFQFLLGNSLSVFGRKSFTFPQVFDQNLSPVSRTQRILIVKFHDMHCDAVMKSVSP